MNKYRAAVCSMGYGPNPIKGIIGKDIFVIPDMDPKYAPEVMTKIGVIAEVGGQLAHLAVVSREMGIVLMVLPNACSLLTPGMEVTLNPSRCEIVVS